MAEPLLKLFGGKSGGREASLDRATRRGEANPMDGAVLATATLTAATPATVAHSLGKTPSGAIPVSVSSAGAPVLTYDSFSAQSFSAEASVDATVVFLVF